MTVNDKKIGYPHKVGDIIMLRETEREAKPLGKRR